MPDPSPPARRLADALDTPTLSAPPASTHLDEARVDHLLGLVTDARRRRARRLGEAVEAGLGMVPRPLRGVIRRMVLGR